jgi:hypothetical protein
LAGWIKISPSPKPGAMETPSLQAQWDFGAKRVREIRRLRVHSGNLGLGRSRNVSLGAAKALD